MYTREIDGKTLELRASGWTYNSVFVLYDYQTESLWYPMSDEDDFSTPLVCVSGTYADKKLSEIPSQKVSWSAWKSTHKETKFMKP